MSNRIYVACLASYNNGVLHGKWIDASNDADEMQGEVSAMLRLSKFPNVTVVCPDCAGIGENCNAKCSTCGGRGEVPSAEEFAIHDHEGEWLDGIQEYSGLAEVARRMSIAAAMDDEGLDEDDAPELFSAYVDHYGAHYITNDTPTEIAERIAQAYRGTYRNREDWAAEWADEIGLLDKVPENLRYYFDFDAWARDMSINGEVDFVAGGDGVRVFNWE